MNGSQRPRIALSGYYGCGNAGDEAVLAGIQSSFASLDAPVDFTILSQNPASTYHSHGLHSVNRMSLRCLTETLRGSDLLISGGGSLLQDTTSMRSLLYYLLVIRVAGMLKVPVMFYAQGLGPLHRKLSRKLVGFAANRAAAITVRDQASADLMTAIGVSQRVEITADPAFALSPPPEIITQTSWRNEGLSANTPWLGVALRAWGDTASDVPRYGELVSALHKQTGLLPLLIPMQHPHDLQFAELVWNYLKGEIDVSILRYPHYPTALLGIISSLPMVIAMRLHTLILAASVGVPAIALSYDPKVSCLMHRLGMEKETFDWNSSEPSAIAAIAGNILQTRAERFDLLCSKSREMRRLALRNAEVALGITGSKGRV